MFSQNQINNAQSVSKCWRTFCITGNRHKTGRGYPDISLIKKLAENLGVSIIELFSGENVSNTNRSFNMLRMKFYVCPLCGNVIQSAGEAVINCCGIVLPALEAEPADDEHTIQIEPVEDDYYVTLPHEMTKTHYISFIAASDVKSPNSTRKATHKPALKSEEQNICTIIAISMACSRQK